MGITTSVGTGVGAAVGLAVGSAVGAGVGSAVGAPVGTTQVSHRILHAELTIGLLQRDAGSRPQVGGWATPLHNRVVVEVVVPVVVELQTPH